MAEVLSVRPVKELERSRLAELARSSDIVFLEGLPTAVACAASLRRATGVGVKIHVDICDSWLRLGTTGRGTGDSLGSLVIRAVKSLMAATALNYVSRYADSVSYISALDYKTDSRFLSRRAKPFIIPNGNPSVVEQLPSFWNPTGPMVVVGDWAYPPNQEMLHAVLKWYGALVNRPGLRVVGPNLGPVPALPEDVAIIGWVDEIEAAYEGVSCALALTSTGSGVKNKVLEPLALGIPVIATQNALNGIDADDHMVLAFERGLSEVEVSTWLESLAVRGVSKLKAPSWEQNTSQFISYLRDGFLN